MKIGVISDIHSNFITLDKVLKEFEKEKVNKIICCGDLIGIGPYPEETMQLIMKNKKKMIIVQGNHERYLINGLPTEVHNDKRNMGEEEIKNHQWTHKKLSLESINFIKELPLYQNIEIENKKVYVIHYPMDKDRKFVKFLNKPSKEENEKLFREIDADIYIYGHTHTKNIVESNNKIYINPGSLGCPKDTNKANYGLLIINSEIKYYQFNVEYDVKQVKKDMENKNIPFSNKILEIFYKEN